MTLYTYCKSCKSQIIIKSSAESRAELEREKGNEFNVNCQNCGSLEKKHVNDVKAKPNKIIILIGISIGIFVTIALWTYYGAISTISGIIPVLFWKEQMKSSKIFNSYRLGRK